MTRRILKATTLLTFLFLACAGNPASQATSAAPAPSVPDNRIPAIQGRAHQSPMVGREIENVEGVVTAVLSGGRAPGFWMQDPSGDDNPATSDAIFVAKPDDPIDVTVGDAVSVSGRVEEAGREGSLTTTQIVASEVRVVSRGNTLPDAVLVGIKGRQVPQTIAPNGLEKYRPRVAAIDFWESLEGMRVEIRDPVVVGPTSRYGDVTVVPDGGLGVRIRSPRGGVVIQEDSFNPQRLLLDRRLAGPNPRASVGDRFEGGVTGIIDYAFGNYRLLNDSALPELVRSAEPPETTRLKWGENRLTIATYNVLNLSAANGNERFASVAESIAVNLGSPDVIGLQEIQDDSGPADDGVVEAKVTFENLIAAIVAAGGPTYDVRQIDPVNNHDGGQPGGNIRVALLFNPERVSFVDRGEAGPADAAAVEGEGESVRLSLSPGRVDPSNPCFSGEGDGELAEPTRKSLAAEMRFGDRTFFVVVNHFKSKRGDGGLFGSTQPPVRRTEEQRTCQAETVGKFAGKILEKNAKAAVIVLGDMNEHEFRAPMKRLVELSGLANLHDRVVVADRYTYVYEGNSQVLDHIFVSPALLREAEIDIVHINADVPEAVAASDHDPILARLRM